MTIGKLTWKKAVTADGFTIGQVEGGEVDTNNWRVTHLHIGLNEEALSEFGLKRPYMGRVLICLPVQYIKSVGEVVTFKQTLKELKETKECKEFTVR